MTLPSLDKTWQHNVNNLRGNTGVNLDDHKDIMFMIKQSLIGETFGGASLGWTGIWSVESSSAGDGVDFGAGDRWASVSDIVWANAGVNHSWIVFRQTATGTEFCIDCSNTSSYNITIIWSPAARFGAAYGGTDGTATTRPTATDEIVTLNNNRWAGGQSSPFAIRVHTMISTDGECTRVIAQIRNNASLLWIFDVVKNPVSGWTNPTIAVTQGSTLIDSSVATYDWYTGAARINGVHGSLPMIMYMAVEGARFAELPSIGYIVSPNDMDGSWPMFPVGLVSETAGARGRHGELFDFWFGTRSLDPGTAFPDDLTRQFVFFRDIIFPWDGSAPQVIG